MWSYYGAKTNVVKYYPAPTRAKIIERFAGSARYSLKYFEHDILLVDKYEVVIKIWKWLQKCSPKDILSLPRLKAGQSLNDFDFDCEEARLLMGFIVAKGVESPRTHTTRWTHADIGNRRNFQNFSLQRIAGNLFKIKHWDIKLGSYDDIPNEDATWFVDPPYEIGGKCYIESSKNIDFTHLGDWCRSRLGQVIACDKQNAGWLPFTPLMSHRTRAGKRQHEGIWLNQASDLRNIQMKMVL